MPTEGAATRPDDPSLADAAASLFGAYLHVPFCRRVCPYCDFAVVAGREDQAERYVAAVTAEIERAEPFPSAPAAVFVGGGTPTRLSPVALARLLRVLERRRGLAPEVEVSLEANPEDWSPAVAASLVAGGFNRVSLGAQSFDSGVLAVLGRRHHPREAEKAVFSAHDAGFASVNVDLICGTPGESPASWRASVERALAAGIDHLSVYALTVEAGTPLSRAVAVGAPAPDPDRQAERWEEAAYLAAAAGLIRYETSNFARPGHACRYNLITWAQGEYEGFGTGAHRHRGGTRSWNVRRLDRYLEAVEAGGKVVSGAETLGPWEQEAERLVLGLRRAAGVRAGAGGGRLEQSEAGRRLSAAGVLERVGDRLRVARPLLGDEVSRAVLALEPADC
ncbi:MAG: radical SAM family heme chaperone HemW [Acidimicrobiia bacterium]|nr:radical SAM family heme chaperone HemW [Acidimicrobiia bacterium]